MTPDEIVTSQLVRFRRRLGVVRAGRLSCDVGVLALAAAAIAVAAGAADVGEALTAACALAVGLACVGGLLRAPSAVDAAVEADARLGLDDRLVTAARCLNDRDPMSRLVVRDAAARIDGLVASRVVPFEPPRHGRRLMAVAGVACVVLTGSALSNTAGEDRWMTGPAQDRPLGESEAIARTATERGGNRITPVLVPRKRPQIDSSRSIDPRRRDGGPSREALPSSESKGERSPQQSASAGPPRNEPAPPVAAGDRTGERDVDARAPAGSADAAALALRPGGRQRGGSAAAAAPARRDRPPAGDDYRSRHRAAAARAEAVIAREQVPDGLRDYLRAYFVAIRP